jgi:hypothetical protein
MSANNTIAICAAGKLCASYIFAMDELPEYAAFFHPSRYENVEIIKAMNELDSDGQL